MPIAKRSPRLEKIASPAAAMGAMSSRSGCPSRSSSPATGSTAIGSINARPRSCVFSDQRHGQPPARRARAARARARAPPPRFLLERARASSRHSPASRRRTVRFRRGIIAGVAETSCTPRPMRMGSASTSEPIAPHTDTLLPSACPASATFRDQAQHRRMQRVEPRRPAADEPRSIASAYCARSLVPMERKSASGRELLGEHRGRGRLDHHADRGNLHAQLASAFGGERANRAQLLEVVHHRQQDAALAARLGAQDRAQLRAQQVGRHRLARTPRSPSAGIVLARHRQVGDRLVAADVERADVHGLAVERRSDALGIQRPARPRRAASRGRGTGTRCAAARSLRRRSATAARLGERAHVRIHE